MILNGLAVFKPPCTHFHQVRLHIVDGRISGCDQDFDVSTEIHSKPSEARHTQSVWTLDAQELAQRR